MRVRCRVRVAVSRRFRFDVIVRPGNNIRGRTEGPRKK